MEADTVAKVLMVKYIAYFGAPDCFCSDQGRSFEAQFSRSCAMFSTSTRRGPPRTIRKGTDKLKDSIAHSWTCCPLCARRIGSNGMKCSLSPCWRTTVASTRALV
ncbi:hypothetical protein T05_4848 [Trichinella murrelli]|uniref:Integrase catalytic domain-containing protein n=1 Tax=Trichinella murrelli TaxID=144512 RepID=A0A0V0T3R8_9BILA|nr:hypothetical protein T05_4848 [Trichinella murrelli]